MNKIYFLLDTSHCGYPILNSPQDQWSMNISTVVHNYVTYRFNLNNRVVISNKNFRAQLLNVLKTSYTFAYSEQCSHILKALIVSLIQNQGHNYSVYQAGIKTVIVDNTTREVYLCGTVPNGRYNFYFQVLSTSHLNYFHVKIWDPDYSISDERLKAAIDLNKRNYFDNIERLKQNPVSIISNDFEIEIMYDPNENEEKLVLDNIEIYSKDHLKISIKEKLIPKK